MANIIITIIHKSGGDVVREMTSTYHKGTAVSHSLQVHHNNTRGEIDELHMWRPCGHNRLPLRPILKLVQNIQRKFTEDIKWRNMMPSRSRIFGSLHKKAKPLTPPLIFQLSERPLLQTLPVRAVVHISVMLEVSLQSMYL